MKSHRFIQEQKFLIQDRFRWKSWLRKKPDSAIEAYDLLTLFEQYHNGSFCRQTIKLVRDRKMLLPTESSKRIMSELIVSLEDFIFFSNRIKTTRRNARDRVERTRTKKEMIISSTLSPLERFLDPIAQIFGLRIKASRSLKRSRALLMTRRIEHYSGSVVFTEWLKRYTQQDKNRFASLGSEFLDEAYLLLEELRNS